MMPPLDKRLRDAVTPDDEDAMYGILAALFLVLPAAVRATDPAVVLKQNGYCFLPALVTLTVHDLEQLGVLRGHAQMVMSVLRPAPPETYDVTPDADAGSKFAPPEAQNATQPAPNGGRPPYLSRPRCRPFPAQLTSRAWRAFLMTFVVVLRTIGLPTPVPDAVFIAGSRPSEAVDTLLDADMRGLVWDTLLSVEGGLPDDILLGIPESVLLSRDGVAAVRHIGSVVMTTSDQSIAALPTWYNAPNPITKPTDVSVALREWLRAEEQLAAQGATPAAVQRRISLMTLFERVPEVQRAFEALQATSEIMDIDDMIAAVTRIGNKYTSVAAQKRAIAMMSGTSKVEQDEHEKAMVAVKKPKHGRCKFHDSGHCKFGNRCRFHHIGPAGNGHPPPPGRTAPPAYTPPAPAEDEGEDTAVADLAGVLAQLLRGVSASCRCSVTELVSVISRRLQTMNRKTVQAGSEHGSGKPSANAEGLLSKQEPECGGTGAALVSIVCDTAATMPVVGADMLGAVAPLNRTPVSVSLGTAQGTAVITEAVDVPDARGLMDKSLVVSGCSRSLCPVVTVCESKNLGFEIDQGATGARFLSGSETFLELDREGDFFVFDVPVDSGYESCEECDESLFSSVAESLDGSDEWGCVECSDEHAMVLMSAGESVQSAFVAKFDLGQHCRDGHRPYNAKCPWCVAGGMRAKQAFRVPRTDRVCERGYAVSADFSGPFDPDVDGNTQAFIGVDLESSKGFVGLQQSRSAADTLESVKHFEAELKSCAADPSVGIVEFHHDDDTSFRSCVEEYARERGWSDTHTGGYNPNGNSLAERRIGMFNQLVRTFLLCATGGFRYYDQLWGRALVHASDVVDWTPFGDRVSPLSKLAGHAVEPPAGRHPFGAYCLYRVPREKRKKFEPPARMGVWVGISKRTRHGHLIVPIVWCAGEQRFRLGSTVDVNTVKVYDNVFPLRMEPPNGEFGSQDFNDFVDSLMEPLFNKHLVPDMLGVGTASDVDVGSDECSVEVVKKKRVKHGVVQYLVKWIGYNNRHNTWVDLDDMQCDDVIAEFDCASALSAVVRVDPKDTL